MLSSWPKALIAYILLYFIILELFLTKNPSFASFPVWHQQTARIFHLMFWFIIATSAKSGKSSLMYLLGQTIQEVLWFLPLTQMLLDDHGWSLTYLPLPLGHLVEQDLWQMMLNTSFLKVIMIFFLSIMYVLSLKIIYTCGFE